MSLLEDTAWDPKHRVTMSAIGLVFVGCSLALWGGLGDFKLMYYSSREPQQITAGKLASEGPGNNLHVSLTDFRTSAQGYGNDNVAWFVIFPIERSDGQASLLLKTKGGNSFFGVVLPEQDLQGIVRNGSNTLNSKQRNGIKKLGRVNFDNLWIVDHNRKPPPWWSFLLKVFGGFALFGTGVLIFIANNRD